MTAARQPRRRVGADTGLVRSVALFLFYGVTLTKEPIWIGWRAGQILLVTIPPLVALLFARLLDAGRRGPAVAVIAIALVVGLPTTGDRRMERAGRREHGAMGPGFHWTVAVPPDTQAADARGSASTPTPRRSSRCRSDRGAARPGRSSRRSPPAAWPPASRSLCCTSPSTTSGRRPSTRCSGRPTRRRHRAWRDRSASTTSTQTRSNAPPSAAAAVDKFRDTRYFTPVFEQGDAVVFEVR